MTNTPNLRGEMLLAIFKYTRSLTILQEEGWYHVPVRYAPKTWPPKWMCFYQGKVFEIDIETDGDTWHARADRIPSDNERNNQLAQKGWRILRYNGKQLRTAMGRCIDEVKETINNLKGLSDEGLVPRIFYQQGNQPVQQLSMFEPRAPYHLDSGAAENLEE